MKNGLQPGQTGRLQWTVTPERTITLEGHPEATVFSTPFMIMMMERASREALRPYLEEGEESVGVKVNIEHLAGAPLGADVHAVSKVTKVDGRRVDFDVEAYHGETLIGRGTHQRAVVKVERIIDNIRNLEPASALPNRQSTISGELPQLDFLRVEVEKEVVRVTLNRPHVLNAISEQTTYELETLLAWLSGHPGFRVVVFHGQGRAFCAGDDVKELDSFSVEKARAISHRQAELFLAFERLPQITIAAVNGSAMGAGCVLAYSCDFRIAAHSARFGMPEAVLGWPPGYGMAQLTALIGKARTLDLCLTGRILTAREAQEWGLVNDAVPNQRLKSRTDELVKQLLAMPAKALRETKRIIHADEPPSHKVGYRLDTEAYVNCLDTEDARKGIQRFKK